MRAVVIGNGHPGPTEFYFTTIRPDDFLICADGGANLALELEFVPDVVVGDMDSIDASVRAELVARGATEFVTAPSEKDESDTELALKNAIARSPDEIILTGMLGGRLDHALANIGLLAAVPDEVKCAIVEPSVRIELVRGSAEIEARPGQVVSILPFAGEATGVTLAGFKYPLNDGVLSADSTLGLSNVMIAETASVAVAKGAVLIILPL